jgi:hypothetical protein
MRNASNCTLVAAALSNAYRTYNGHDFSPDTMRLEDFLDRNGVLLTMCMRYGGLFPWLECSRSGPAAKSLSSSSSIPGDAVVAGGRDPSRLEASWVQRDQTRGFRVIGPPIDVGPPVGLVLRPSGTSIRCIYPVDGATDGRDDGGCGPLTDDPRYGSQGYDHAKWYRKLIMREEIVLVKNSHFGPDRPWESIPCADFFPAPPSPSGGNTTADLQVLGSVEKLDNGTRYEWRYQTQTRYMVDYWSHILGHTLCNQSAMPPEPSPNAVGDEMLDLIWTAPFSWPPSEWHPVVEMMQLAIDDPPFSLRGNIRIWNELVLDVPIDEQEFASRAVQAVFYIKGISGIVVEEIARRVARREARRLRKALLYVELSANGTHQDATKGDIFQCAE